jgi:uncharacterized protein
MRARAPNPPRSINSTDLLRLLPQPDPLVKGQVGEFPNMPGQGKIGSMRMPFIVPCLAVLAASVALAHDGSRAGPEHQPQAVEITFTGVGGMELSGTLLLPPLPDGRGSDAPAAPHPFPAALLLPGSGPTDRNGNQPPMLVTDLLKQIAERLADEGVATLRFDKRAAQVYAEVWSAMDADEMNEFFRWEHFVGDARAALDVLRKHPATDPKRIAIIGHSEGGLIALQIAHDTAGTDDAPVALALLAAAGRTIDHLVREQIERMMKLQGANDALIAEYLAHIDGAVVMVKERRKVPDDLPPGLRPLFNPTVTNILHAYFTIDPADLARAFRGPVLVMQGENDVQVSHERDMPRLAAALRERENANVKSVLIPEASHNFKRVRSDHAPGFTGPVAPEALDAIAGWCRTVSAPVRGRSAPP